VPTNKSCSFTVTFTPTATGAVAPVTLTVQAGGTNLPLALKGTGVQPLYLSVSKLAFGNEAVNVISAPKTVTVYNYSGATVAAGSGGNTGSNPADFAADASACGAVANGGSCQLSVTFTPSTTAAESATIKVVAGANSVPLTVTGTGK
jgi:hypothetical protein